MIASALLCAYFLTAGNHVLECKAEYLHTLPSGERYWHEVTRGQFIIGGQLATCSGEGHPDRVTLKDLGAVVCRAEMVLFEDGFESGTTDSWTSAVP
jgi:hypothetical protein